MLKVHLAVRRKEKVLGLYELLVNNDFFDFTLDFHRIFFVEAPKSSLGEKTLANRIV